MRTRVISFIISSVFIFLVLGIFNLQVKNGRIFRELSNKNCIRLLPQEGNRGRILDRNGQVIVDSYLSYDALVLPQEEESLDKVLATVSGVLGMGLRELKDNYRKNFISSSMPVVVAENIEVKKAIALEELKSQLGDLLIQPHPLRHYPYGKLACHAIGYLHEIDRWRLTRLADYGYKIKDIVGFCGVEERYDYYLRQEEGALSIEVDHRGRFIRVLGFKPPRNGKDIQLTLDLKIQKIAEDALADKKGAIIIIEPTSGEILAMVSYPGFNPAIFVKKSESAIRNVVRDYNAPLLNRAISGVYPAASVFKLVVSSAALETGKINLGTTFVCTGSIFVGRRQFSCWDTHGPQSLIGGIAHSCDVFFYRTGLATGAQAIHDYALQFGFSKVGMTDLPYAQGGLVPDPLWKRFYRMQGWFDGDTANFAIGQGELLVTPIQMARMVAVFANKGELVNPYIVKAVAGKDITAYQRKSIKVPVKESNLEYIRQGMRQVVVNPGGTAKILADLKIGVAGKTGTAQVPRGNSHAWFVGFFPFKKPQFAICVLLEHGGHGYASAVLAKQIIEAMSKEGLINEKL